MQMQRRKRKFTVTLQLIFGLTVENSKIWNVYTRQFWRKLRSRSALDSADPRPRYCDLSNIKIDKGPERNQIHHCKPH